MNKNIIYRILFVIGVIVIAAGLVYLAFMETVPELLPLIEKGNTAEIEAYLEESSTFKGILCAVLLSMVQVWSMFIPGMPIQVAVGAVYGLFIGLVACHLSSVLAQYIAIKVMRRLGNQMEKWMPVNTEKESALSEILNSTTPPEYKVITACLIPVLPNGVIAFFASKMDITPERYALAVWVGSFLNVLLCCAAGDRIMSGDWIIAAIYFAFLLCIVICLWVFRHKILDVYYSVTARFHKGSDTEV